MPSREPQPASGPRVLTLVIASLSSVAAALVVRSVWGPGTLVGAAATPIIVTLVAELLQRPAERLPTVLVTPSGTRVHQAGAARPRAQPTAQAGAPYDPVAAGQAGLSSGAEPGYYEPLPPAPAARSRRPLYLALVAGLAAFIIGAALLTGSELIFGSSSVGSSHDRTTLFNGATHKSKSKAKTKTKSTTSSTTQTPSTSTPTTPAATTPSTTTPTSSTPATGATGATGATSATGASGAQGP